MKTPCQLPVTLTKTEQRWGFVYLVLALLILPLTLTELNALLPAPLTDSWLNILYFSLNFIFTGYIFRGFLRRSLAQAGKHAGKFLLVTIIGFGVYYVCSILLGILIRTFASDFANLNDDNIAQQFQEHFLLMAVCTGIMVPVSEELLHRGLVFGSLYNKNEWLAYGFSAIFFSIIHIAGYLLLYPLPHLLLAFVQYLPAGLVLAWAYRKSGSIFAPILIHATVNTVQLLSLR